MVCQMGTKTKNKQKNKKCGVWGVECRSVHSTLLTLHILKKYYFLNPQPSVRGEPLNAGNMGTMWWNQVSICLFC